MTAEAAVACPALVLFVMALVWALTAAAAQIQCVDAARAGARAAARSEPRAAALAAARSAAPNGSVVTLTRSGDLWRVNVESDTPGPGALALTLSAEAVALAEDTVGQEAEATGSGAAGRDAEDRGAGHRAGTSVVRAVADEEFSAPGAVRAPIVASEGPLVPASRAAPAPDAGRSGIREPTLHAGKDRGGSRSGKEPDRFVGVSAGLERPRPRPGTAETVEVMP
ncbi:TadE family type IV pilus minor pilin [Streptomyces xantholiticus]|uniref:TadE family type IV pilus minor pilin n=1 Tax=Streptomyces xantholiticus TaxID=68285 RepID=UPI0027E54F65|nr:TadE family type IV pilus minor pilin [Streptomyces xantholiticus]